MNAEPSIPTLLDEQAWMRRLARRLVEDEASADDLVQQAWLALLKRPPAAGPGLRGFLATVLRRLASKREHGDARRTQRELRAEIAPREIPSPEELAAEVDAQRELVEAVLALDEPYRETVLLRWFRDLSTHGIAKHQGVPLGTVETRLKRAHARLREELTRKHDGDARRWILPLMPVAAQATLPVGTSVLVTLGVLVMSKALFLAAAGAVAVTTLFWFGVLRDDGGVDPAPLVASNEPAAPTIIAPEQPAERLASAAIERDRPAPPQTATRATCRVRVLRSDGTPVPEASLAIERGDSFTPFPARTDIDGVVEIDREPGTLRIWVISDSSAPVRLESSLSDAETTLSLPRGHAISGRVEVDGQPPTQPISLTFYPDRPFPALADAKAELYDWIKGKTTFGSAQLHVHSGEGGRFEFDGLAEGFSGWLRMNENERFRVAEPTGQITLRAPSADSVIRLRSTPRLRGRAVLADGSPAAKVMATLDARSANGNYEMRNRRVANDGRFDIPIAMEPADKLSFVLRSEAGEMAVREFVGIPDRDQELGDVVLTQAVNCHYRVLDEAGKPIAGAFAFWLSDSSHPAERTGSDGSGELPYPTTSSETPRLCVSAEGCELVVVKPTPGETRTLDITLRKSVRLFITLEPRAAEWPSEIRFIATSSLAAPADWIEAFEGLSRTPFGTFFSSAEERDGKLVVSVEPQDGKGSAMIDHLPSVIDWNVSVYHTGFGMTLLAEKAVRASLGEVTPIALEAALPHVCKGRVIDGAGNPVRGATVYASVRNEKGSSMRANAQTSGDGSFTLGGLFCDRVDLLVASEDFAPRALDDISLSQTAPPIEIVLEKGRAVTTTVLDATGQRVSNARVVAKLFGSPTDPHPSEISAREEGDHYRFAALPVARIAAQVTIGEHTLPFTIESATNEYEVRIPADR